MSRGNSGEPRRKTARTIRLDRDDEEEDEDAEGDASLVADDDEDNDDDDGDDEEEGGEENSSIEGEGDERPRGKHRHQQRMEFCWKVSTLAEFCDQLAAVARLLDPVPLILVLLHLIRSLGVVAFLLYVSQCFSLHYTVQVFDRAERFRTLDDSLLPILVSLQDLVRCSNLLPGSSFFRDRLSLFIGLGCAECVHSVRQPLAVVALSRSVR